MISGVPAEVFCDMVTDGGGWMYIITGSTTKLEYINQFGDASQISNTLYRSESGGISWASDVETSVAFTTRDIPFSDIRLKLSGSYDEPGRTGMVEVVTASSGTVMSLSDTSSTTDGHTLIVNGEFVFQNRTDALSNFPVVVDTDATGDINTLTIRMKSEDNGPYAKKFVSMVAVR
jgi:hypothetical protein